MIAQLQLQIQLRIIFKARFKQTWLNVIKDVTLLLLVMTKTDTNDLGGSRIFCSTKKNTWLVNLARISISDVEAYFKIGPSGSQLIKVGPVPFCYLYNKSLLTAVRKIFLNHEHSATYQIMNFGNTNSHIFINVNIESMEKCDPDRQLL